MFQKISNWWSKGWQNAFDNVEAFRSGQSYYNKDWRTPEAELTANSYKTGNGSWRVPYGVDSPQERALMHEIRRRANKESLAGLSWGTHPDPRHPANNPEHELFIRPEEQI